jgi:hypothetical protein
MTRARVAVEGWSALEAKKKPARQPFAGLIATHAKLKIAATRSQQRTSQFLIATEILFPGIATSPRLLVSLPSVDAKGVAKPPSRLYPPDRGARMFHSIIERIAIPGGAIQ